MSTKVIEYPNRVRDAVHGFIRLTDSEVSLMDFPEFQRLRRIKQLALTSYVYPGAMHSRFEHTLGVVELVTKMFLSIKRNTPQKVWNKMVINPLQLINLSEENALQVLRLAALLHDIGHLPFSHAAEAALPRGYKHEHVSVAVAESLRGKIDELFFQGAAQRAAQLIDKDGMKCPTEMRFLRELLSGQMDSDRCDYLLRDSLHCGVNYGLFDLERLLECLILIDEDGAGKVAIQKGGLHAVEALILARYYMFSQVYYHRTRRLFDYYLTSFLRGKIAPVSPNNLIEVLKWDDDSVSGLIKETANQPDDAFNGLATQLLYRGGQRGKHTVVYETSEFSDTEELKRVLRVVNGLNGKYADFDMYVDKDASGVIHKFFVEGDHDEQYDQFRIVKSRDSSLVTKESRVIKQMPRQFWIVRVYAKGTDAGIKNLRKEIDRKMRGA